MDFLSRPTPVFAAGWSAWCGWIAYVFPIPTEFWFILPAASAPPLLWVAWRVGRICEWGKPSLELPPEATYAFEEAAALYRDVVMVFIVIGLSLAAAVLAAVCRRPG